MEKTPACKQSKYNVCRCMHTEEIITNTKLSNNILYMAYNPLLKSNQQIKHQTTTKPSVYIIHCHNTATYCQNWPTQPSTNTTRQNLLDRSWSKLHLISSVGAPLLTLENIIYKHGEKAIYFCLLELAAYLWWTDILRLTINK